MTKKKCDDELYVMVSAIQSMEFGFGFVLSENETSKRRMQRFH
jgi:hypothetical protein